MRSGVRLAACALVATVTACGGQTAGDAVADAPTAGARAVNVYNWPDYIAPGLLQRFESETGIKVNYDSFDSVEMLETKMLTGNSG